MMSCLNKRKFVIPITISNNTATILENFYNLFLSNLIKLKFNNKERVKIENGTKYSCILLDKMV